MEAETSGWYRSLPVGKQEGQQHPEQGRQMEFFLESGDGRVPPPNSRAVFQWMAKVRTRDRDREPSSHNETYRDLMTPSTTSCQCKKVM